MLRSEPRGTPKPAVPALRVTRPGCIAEGTPALPTTTVFTVPFAGGTGAFTRTKVVGV
jgi:hypothetical protein